MSQVTSVRDWASGNAAGAAAMSDAELADEHRGLSFAKRRAEDALKAIEAELTARGRTVYVGALGRVEKKDTVGLVDLKRLRAERPDIVEAYALPGSRDLWSSATLPAHERRRDGIDERPARRDR